MAYEVDYVSSWLSQLSRVDYFGRIARATDQHFLTLKEETQSRKKRNPEMTH